MVLGHLSRPVVALQHGIEAVRPGGILAVQTFERIEVDDDPRWPSEKRAIAAAIRGHRDAMVDLFERKGKRVLWGSDLPETLAQLGERAAIAVELDALVPIEGPLAMFLPVMTNKVAGFRQQWMAMPRNATFSEDDRRARLDALDALERAAAIAGPYGDDTDVLRWQHRLSLVRRVA